MHAIETDRDLCESFLVDRYHARTEALDDGPALRRISLAVMGAAMQLDGP